MRARRADQLRSLTITPGVNCWAEGSCLVEWGRTRVYVTATVEEKVPAFLRGKGQGWVTGEYAMVPRATDSRNQRESVKGRQSGRSQEISRLVGRSLRAAVDLTLLGERQILIDCDVLQADGGTRCASITGGYVALVLALRKLRRQGLIAAEPILRQVGALSVGFVDGTPMVDLDYREDSRADVDLNLVADARGGLIEIQGTGEHGVFTPEGLSQVLAMSRPAFETLFAAQREALKTLPSRIVIATGNAHKFEEFQSLLKPLGAEALFGKDLVPELDPEETGETFAQNARIKAECWARACNLPALADDSGLVVDALGGRPGVYSARYAEGDVACRAKLLDELEGVEDRQAAFVSALCLCDSDGSVICQTEGRCAGSIAKEEQGSGGFGYDSLFVPAGFQETFASMSPEEKNACSHRGKALAGLYSRFAG